MGLNERLAYALEDSPVRELAVYLLGNVPGLPPIVQSLHIMGIAAVMASIVMVNLKFLGLAVPSQNVSEMIGRLMPWTWWALLLNAVPGGIFVWLGRHATSSTRSSESSSHCCFRLLCWRLWCTASTRGNRAIGDGRRRAVSPVGPLRCCRLCSRLGWSWQGGGSRMRTIFSTMSERSLPRAGS